MKLPTHDIRGKVLKLIHNMSSSTSSSLATLSRVPKAKVVIVGAGAAGIACAVKLLDAGISDVRILEAENRIGGRLHSVPYGRSRVDLGAQWCHGETDNIVYQIVRDRGCLQTSKCTYKDNTFFDSSGQQVDQELTDELFGFAANIMNDLRADDASLGHYFIKNFIQKTTEEYGANDKCTMVALQFLDWFHKLMLCYDAAPCWFDISTMGLIEYKECEGDPLLNWKDKGYGYFLEVLMAKYAYLIKTKLVHLNKVVKTVVWDNSAQGLDAVIHCEDGSFYNATHVVMTASVGVLKHKHRNMFVPSLPRAKIEAIHGLGFGIVNKIMLKFPHQWWTHETNFCFLWKEADKLNLLNQYSVGPMKNGKSWLGDINGFYVIDSDPTILMGWMLGDLAHETEKLSDADIEHGCMFLLHKFLDEHYDIPAPESVLISRWHSNTNFYGSYSYRSIAGQNRNVCNKDLAEPLLNANGRPVVQFAGEATHSHYFSTVHGAVETGFREAKRIVSYHSKHDEIVMEELPILLSKM